MIIFPIAFSVPTLISNHWANQNLERSNISKLCSYFPPSQDAAFLADIEHYFSERKVNISAKSLLNSDSNSILVFQGTIFRTIIIPLAVAGWYIEEFYIQGFSPMDVLSNKQDFANSLALKYDKRLYGDSFIPFHSASAPSTFVAKNFLYFGFYSIPLSLLGVMLLDIAFLLVCSTRTWAGWSLAAIGIYYPLIFAQSGFGTTLLSHGYIVYSVACCTLYFFAKKKQIPKTK